MTLISLSAQAEGNPLHEALQLQAAVESLTPELFQVIDQKFSEAASSESFVGTSSNTPIIAQLAHLDFYMTHLTAVKNLPYKTKRDIRAWIDDERLHYKKSKRGQFQDLRYTMLGNAIAFFSLSFRPDFDRLFTTDHPVVKEIFDWIHSANMKIKLTIPNTEAQRDNQRFRRIIKLQYDHIVLQFEILVQENLLKNIQLHPDQDKSFLEEQLTANRAELRRKNPAYHALMLKVARLLQSKDAGLAAAIDLDLDNLALNAQFHAQVVVPKGESVQSYVITHHSKKAWDKYEDRIISLNEEINVTQVFTEDTKILLPLKLYLEFPPKKPIKEKKKAQETDEEMQAAAQVDEVEALEAEEEEALVDSEEEDALLAELENAKEMELLEDEEAAQKKAEVLQKESEQKTQEADAKREKANDLRAKADELKEKAKQDPSQKEAADKAEEAAQKAEAEAKAAEAEAKVAEAAAQKAEEAVREQRGSESKEGFQSEQSFRDRLKEEIGTQATTASTRNKTMADLIRDSQNGPPKILAFYTAFDGLRFRTSVESRATPKGFIHAAGLGEDPEMEGDPKTLIQIEQFVAPTHNILFLPSGGAFREFMKPKA